MKNKNLIKFHIFIENEVIKLRYGTLTCNVVIKNGLPVLKTLNIVKNRRKKY